MNNNLNKEANTLAWIAVICAFALFCIIMYFCFNSCSAKPEKINYPEEVDTVLVKPDMFHRVDFHCIEDIVYSPDDGMWSVEYNNQDQFDYEWLAFVTERDEWYDDYIRCDISENDVPHLNNDIMMWKNADEWEKDSIEGRWIIVEHWCSEVNDIRFAVELK